MGRRSFFLSLISSIATLITGIKALPAKASSKPLSEHPAFRMFNHGMLDARVIAVDEATNRIKVSYDWAEQYYGVMQRSEGWAAPCEPFTRTCTSADGRRYTVYATRRIKPEIGSTVTVACADNTLVYFSQRAYLES